MAIFRLLLASAPANTFTVVPTVSSVQLTSKPRPPLDALVVIIGALASYFVVVVLALPPFVRSRLKTRTVILRRYGLYRRVLIRSRLKTRMVSTDSGLYRPGTRIAVARPHSSVCAAGSLEIPLRYPPQSHLQGLGVAGTTST